MKGIQQTNSKKGITMIHKRYLMAFAISFFTCFEALAQFAGVVEQFPTSDYSQKPACFKLSEITAALETDAATLVDALDSWVNEESEPNMFFLKLADGLSDNYSEGKGCFWVNVAGIPQEWNDDNSDLRWYSNIGWNIEDDVFIIYMGQYPDQCVVGDEFNPVFVLKYGEKTVDLYVTFRIVAKPEIPAPTTLVESELNIVGEKEIILEQNPRYDNGSETIKLNIRDAISELGIENKTILTDLLSEILYCTNGGYSDDGLFIKNDNLTNKPTPDIASFCLNAVHNEEGVETGECSRALWDNYKFYMKSFSYTPETFELTCRLGQKPGMMVSGDHYYVNWYLIYGDKAYRLTYILNIIGAAPSDVITNKEEASAMGFFYNLISKTKEAEVISNPNKYEGDIIVPESVEYDGDVYTVTSIGESAFSMNRISSVTLPNSIATIKSNAFYNCSNLRKFYFSKSIISIGHRAFEKCTGLSSLILPTSLTTIESYAFSGCSGLTTLTIPDNVTTIGESTFSGCKGLRKVILSHNVKEYNSTFTQCESLNSIEIPNGVTILYKTFLGCTSIEAISIPNTVTDLSGAFSGCTKLSSISLSKSLMYIGEMTFRDCKSITTIEIPISVTTIHNSAFSGCTGLTSITIPNNVTSIGGSAFSGCTQLKTIIIGENIKVISYNDNPYYAPGYSFSNCQELMDVYCYAENVPITSSNTFENSLIEYATLHVPAASLEAYKAATPWSGFKNIVPIDGETPIVEKCATPTITYANGKVRFACETEGVEYVPTVTCTPDKLQNGNELAIGGTFTVSVYAVKEGYENSDTATTTINMSQMGDVNADGELNAADITAVVNAILGK